MFFIEYSSGQFVDAYKIECVKVDGLDVIFSLSQGEDVLHVNRRFTDSFLEQLQEVNKNNSGLMDLSVSVHSLGLTTRTYNCLLCADIHTVKQLLRVSDAELKKIPRLGSKVLAEIKDVLASNGY